MLEWFRSIKRLLPSDGTGDENKRGVQLVPVFSTCSMHILTKLGTDVFSRWHRLVRLQPNTWSEWANTHWLLAAMWKINHDGVSLCCTLSDYLWCSPCLGRPDTWAGVSGTSWASSWFFSGLMSPYSRRSSSLRETSRVWVHSFKTPIMNRYTVRRPGLSHLGSSWSPGGLSPCPVSQLLETRACPPRWPRLTPRPGEEDTHTIRHSPM